ncbi:MAG: GMC oxidoreductase, partial [Candidatus Korarchaeota archaeon]|nr:GMC oxidoreductase [Candidatus Korarchaeota archaeon]
VKEVLVRNGEAKGVVVMDRSGLREESADLVVLAAGGLETPKILLRSGIEAGDGLFADLFVNTYGMMRGARWREEMSMATVIRREGYILSPILDTQIHMLLYLPLRKKLMAFRRGSILGMITKIGDDASGIVREEGVVKPVTPNDREKLDEGVRISKEILLEVGVESSSIYTTGVRGAHVGGTAAMGRVINREHETEISGLYVGDASALPRAPGETPVLTIVALAKRLSKIVYESAS